MLLGALRALAANDSALLLPAFYLRLLASEGLSPQLDECVSHDVVDTSVVRVRCLGLLAPRERPGEIVPRRGERGHPDHRVEVRLRVDGERTSQDRLGLRVIAGVGRDPRL